MEGRNVDEWVGPIRDKKGYEGIPYKSPLVYVKTKGENCPMLICQRCGKFVKDAQMAIVAWDWTDDPSEDDCMEAVVLCKNPCGLLFRDSLTDEAQDMLVFLILNSGLKNVGKKVAAVRRGDHKLLP